MKRRLLQLSTALGIIFGLAACGGGGGGGDGGGGASTNNNPVITSGAAPSVAENGTAVLTVAGTDADGDPLAYALTGGADQNRFSIAAASGALAFVAAPNFEAPGDADTDNVYAVQVTVSDGRGGSVVQNLTVTVTDVAEASTIQGVAAAGAPILGTVTVKDSSDPARVRTGTIAADGSYTIDVTGMTGPFALRADGTVGGREYHLYSAATDADLGGTVNITPLTDLILANIAGDVASAYYESGAFASLSAAQMDEAEAVLQAKLQPILTAVGVETSIDLLRSAFSADHTQLDAVLDLVRIEVDPQTLTAEIKNILTDTTVSLNVAEGSYTGEFSGEDGTTAAEGATALAQIVAGFQAFSALFADQLPSPDNPTLRGLFDEANFLHDGVGLDLFLSEPTSDPNLVGIQFTNISVLSLDPEAGTGEVSFDIILDGVQMVDAPSRFRMVRSNGTWLMQGNQRIADVWVETRAFLYPGETPARIDTGFSLSVEDNGNRGIDYAIVTGPGLPAEGVVLAKSMEHESFRIFDGTAVTDSNFYALDESAVASIPATGAEYTFALWGAAGTPQELADDSLLTEYTVKILARPLRPSELSSAQFPTITAPSASTWAGYSGGAVDVQWTIPDGCRADYVHGYIRGDGWLLETEETLAPNATSATLTMAAEGPLTFQNLSVGVMDVVGRSFTTVLW